MKNKKIELTIIIYGLSMMIALATTLMVTFMHAYLSPGKQTMVTLNTMGEADIEFVLILISVPCMIYGLYWLLTEEK